MSEVNTMQAAALAAKEAAEAAALAAKERAEQKAAKDAAKAEKSAAAAQKKADRLAEKEAKKHATEQRKINAAAKREAKEEAKATREPAVTNNGVTRPRNGSKTALIWTLADMLSADIGAPIEISPLIAGCKSMSSSAIASAIGAEDTGDLVLPEATVRTQYASWRKFNGLTGRQKTVADTAADATGTSNASDAADAGTAADAEG